MLQCFNSKDGSFSRQFPSTHQLVSTTMSKEARKHYGCVTEFALDVLGGKWKTIILAYLMQQPLRYGELRKMLPRLSDKVLTQRLAELENAGLVQRSGPQTASAYALTPRGESLRKVLSLLCNWGKTNAKAFGATYDEPLARLKPPSRSSN